MGEVLQVGAIVDKGENKMERVAIRSLKRTAAYLQQMTRRVVILGISDWIISELKLQYKLYIYKAGEIEFDRGVMDRSQSIPLVGSGLIFREWNHVFTTIYTKY